MASTSYDLSQLEELAGGSEEFVRSMVETFLEHTPGQLQEMIESYKSSDLENMGKLAHKIKPNIDLFGISEIKDHIRKIEKYGKAGENSNELPTLINKVEAVLNKAFGELKSF